MSNSPLQVSDRELVERFNAGDRPAFDELVDRYSGRAYQIAFGILGNRQDAEEVAQDAFVRVLRALPKFRGDSEFTTWLYRITVNLARNKFRWNRSRGSQKNVSIDEPVEGREVNSNGIELPAPRMNPEEEAMMQELETNVAAAIENLPPLYREPLVMRNVEEMSYEAIASLLGCRLGTVKSRIARGREELRKRLGL